MRITILLIILFLTLSGCAGAKSIKPNSFKQSEADFSLAKTLLDKVFSAYTNYSRQEYIKLLDSDFVPDRYSFLNSLETNFYQATILELNYFINEVLSKNNKLAISFKWQKKTSPYNSTSPVLTEGNAQFIFKKSLSGWLLYEVKGDSPF